MAPNCNTTVLALALGLLACERGRREDARVAERASGSELTEAGNNELRALVTEALTPQLCPRLLGSFLGLPGEGGASSGPAAGSTPSAGRWWVRACEARVSDTRIELSLSGVGWTWIDRETSGFRVRQYLLFEAEAALGADVSVGYDPARRVASLWMRPATGLRAHVTPRGVVSPTPTGFFSSLLGAAARVTGASVEDRARAQAEELGSTQLRDRLSAGFTMTYALGTRQVDFMVGALARGETPERPFASDTAQPWVLNQRAMVWPGGLDVLGPLRTGEGALGMDIELEEGEGASVRAVCSDPLTRYFDQRFRDSGSSPEAPLGELVVNLGPGTGVQHITLPRAACPTLLVVAPRGESALPVRVRLRVAPGPRELAATPTRPTRVRVQIIGVTVNPQNPAGRDWDLIGGEADVSVVTSATSSRRQIDRAPVRESNRSPSWNRWLPGAFETARELPLRFTVVDEDATGDELIGTADLEVGDLPTTRSEVTLAVRAQGAVPTQTGSLRLLVEPVE